MTDVVRVKGRTIRSREDLACLNLFIFNFCIHFIFPFGKCRPSYLGKATAAARAAVTMSYNVCWVFSFFCNPPNSDMDYRIFNVRTFFREPCTGERGLAGLHDNVQDRPSAKVAPCWVPTVEHK